MLNFLNALPPRPGPQPMPGMAAPPFQWLPVSAAFLRRRLWPVLGCATLGIALGAGYLAIATPQYTAVATLSIDARRAHPAGGGPASADWQSESAYIESQVELIRSAATLRGVVKALHLDADPLFAPREPGIVAQAIALLREALPGAAQGGLDAPARARAQAGAALLRMVEVWRVGATSVVEVRVHSPDRDLSAALANAVTEAYMAQQLVAISETTRRASSWLEGRIGDLRGQAVGADRAVQEYKARNNIVDVSTGAGIGQMNEQQLGELNVRVAAARARLAETQARLERARASTVNGITNGVISDTATNSVMTTLRQKYVDAARREAELTARQGPSHGAVVLQHAEVMELQRGIQAELARLTETYRGDFEVAQANLTAIQARLAEQVKAAAQTNIERSELRSLQSSADAYRQIYETFLQRFTQAMQDQSYPISDARVAAPALAPMDRSAPRAAVVLGVAGAIGLALGLLLAVLADAMDGTVRTLAQLRQASGLECLGVIEDSPALACSPTRRWLRSSRDSARRGIMLVPTAFRQAARNPDQQIAAAVHAVRVAATRHSARGREVRVIGCVSALADEGSSTFAANLAFALAADGQRTVLLDWPSRSPTLTAMLAPEAKSGLLELANRGVSLAEAALVDEHTGLRFIGQSAEGGATAPSRANTQALLADLRARYDVVVLNLPPLHDGSIALRLSDIVDGFVLVTRWGRTPQSVLSEALGHAGGLDALFLGAVLSHCDSARMRLYPSDATAYPQRHMVPIAAA